MLFSDMDIQLIEERIQALQQSKEACDCQSRQAQQLRHIADLLIAKYEDLKRQLLDALADGFFADDCDKANDLNAP